MEPWKPAGSCRELRHHRVREPGGEGAGGKTGVKARVGPGLESEPTGWDQRLTFKWKQVFQNLRLIHMGRQVVQVPSQHTQRPGTGSRARYPVDPRKWVFWH